MSGYTSVERRLGEISLHFIHYKCPQPPPPPPPVLPCPPPWTSPGGCHATLPTAEHQLRVRVGRTWRTVAYGRLAVKTSAAHLHNYHHQLRTGWDLQHQLTPVQSVSLSLNHSFQLISLESSSAGYYFSSIKKLQTKDVIFIVKKNKIVGWDRIPEGRSWGEKIGIIREKCQLVSREYRQCRQIQTGTERTVRVT